MATLALALFGATSAGAEESLTIYQWTDSDGVYRYTPLLDRIPDHARHTAVMIESSEEPPKKTPIYFDPDPRADVVAIPTQPSQATDSGAAQGGGGAGAYDERIRVLEARIAEYEEALKELISAPGADADVEVPPELREIATRLLRLQAELAALEGGHATVVGP